MAADGVTVWVSVTVVDDVGPVTDWVRVVVVPVSVLVVVTVVVCVGVVSDFVDVVGDAWVRLALADASVALVLAEAWVPLVLAGAVRVWLRV